MDEHIPVLMFFGAHGLSLLVAIRGLRSLQRNWAKGGLVYLVFWVPVAIGYWEVVRPWMRVNVPVTVEGAVLTILLSLLHTLVSCLVWLLPLVGARLCIDPSALNRDQQ